MNEKITSYGIVYMLVIAAFFGFVTFGPGTVSAAGMTFYVDDDNVAGPWDGSMANPYRTINDAIAGATDGDNIYVFNGTYVENVVVDRSLTIIGNGTGNTTIDGGWSGDVVSIFANWVNITGFTITNGSAGMYIDSSSNNNIINNNIGTSFQRGIYMISSSNNIITNNNISGAGYGIWLESSDDNNISANNLSDNEYGVYLSYSLNCVIIGNDFLRGGVMIYGGSQLSYYNSHTIPTDNMVNGNPLYYYKNLNSFDIDGIPVGQVILANCSNVNIRNLDINYTNVGIELALTQNTNITSNNMSNGYYGFYLQGSSDINITSNNISNSQYSIYLSSCSNNDITSNKILDARDGIHLGSSAYNNIINNEVASGLNNGIYLGSSSNENNITGNNVYLNNQRGIYLSSSSDNNVIGNTISSNDNMGIEVYSSSNANISGNTFINDGLFFWGGILAHFNSHTVPTSNTVNGKPLYYYKDTNNLIIDGTTMGQLILANCNDADVKNLEINDTDVGIQVAYSLNASVSDNNLFDNDFGLYYSYSDDGIVIGNEVVDHTSNGINMFFSDNNLVTQNNATSNNGFGLYLSFSHNNNLTQNNASWNVEGIDIFQSHGNTVSNNTASNNTEYGIYTHNNCEYNTIINNTVEGNDLGIYLASGGTSYNLVTGNTVTGSSSQGIFLNTVWQNTISNNNISNCLYGIGYANSDANTIINNTVTFNTVGINVNSFSTDNTLKYNTIKNNTGSGIWVSSSSDMNIISYNDINNNTGYGIQISTSFNNLIHRNNIAFNRGSNDTYNPSNIQGYDDSANFWNTSTKGNWWADWTTPDIIAPFGIVDNPYVLDGSGQDNFPLVNPTEGIPPTVTNLQPSNGATLLVNTTTIAANYTDAAGINVSSVMLEVDGFNVTSFSTVEPDGIFYDPGTPFADGTHTINLSVADIHDNLAFESWTFTVDTMWPVIMNKQPSPSSITSDNLTTISADYSDSEGIDIGGVTLKVDNNDETSNATVTASNITYTPMTPLTEGLHTVELIVTDLSGWSTGQLWTFTVDAIPPVIFNMLPINGSTLTVNIPTIAANYTDFAGINPSSVILKINGGNVTSSAAVTVDGIEYTPSVGLTDGVYVIDLEVKNIYDNPANASWSFTIDTTSPMITNLQPLDSMATSEDTIAISANYTDISGIDVGSIVLKVDGVDETLSATVTVDGITFTPVTAWTDGSHTIELSVNDTLSNSVTLIWSFDVDTTSPEGINDLTSSDPTIDSINLTWTASGDDDGSGTATEYVVKYSTSGEITDGNWNSASTYSQSWTPLAAGETETYTITGLDPDTQYWFAIKALDDVSNTADVSNSPDATTLVVTTAPEVPDALELDWGDSYVHLTWDAPASDGNSPITNYVIYRGTSTSSIPFLIEVGNVLTYNDTTATNGITYYYKVSAKNSVGEGPLTNRESAIPVTIPSEPQNVQTSAGIGYIEITWDAPADDGGASITNYVIYRGNASGVETFLIQLGNVLLYNDTSGEEGVTYYYVVRAKNSLDEGAQSTEVSGTPTSPPNQLPISGITSLSSGQVLEGTITISGTASDPESTLERVEMKIDDGQWITVTGTDTWSHALDTTALSNGDHTIHIRSYDGEDYSDEDSVTIEVNNPKPKEDKTLFEEAWFFPLIIIVIIIIVLVLLMAMRKKSPGKGMPEEEDIPPEGAPVEEETEEEETSAEETERGPMGEESPVEEPGEEAPGEEAEEEMVEEELSEEPPSTGETSEETEGGEPEASEGDENIKEI